MREMRRDGRVSGLQRRRAWALAGWVRAQEEGEELEMTVRVHQPEVGDTLPEKVGAVGPNCSPEPRTNLVRAGRDGVADEETGPVGAENWAGRRLVSRESMSGRWSAGTPAAA